VHIRTLIAALAVVAISSGAAAQTSRTTHGPATASAAANPTRTAPAADVVYEATIDQLQAAMASGRATSVSLVDAYLARIAAYDHNGPALNAIIRLNPRARADAAERDAERAAGRVRGPLHGIPIILKDNYATRDMPTTAGSIAFAGMQTPFDAFQVQKLRDAGAVILGKSNLHELASGITTISSLGGQTCNPYDPGRSPGGSSGGSGAAVAASFAAVAWGSDTCGSIRIPSAVNNLFGLRPTKGLSSTAGIVPLSHTQDVAGPLARTVRDLAIALDATVGPDPADTATHLLAANPLPRFVESLDSTSLHGARIGAFTEYFGTDPDDQEASRVVHAALDRMKARGAEIIDVAIPGLDSIASGAGVIPFELKDDLLDYLAHVPNVPVKSLGQALDSGLYHIALEQTLKQREAQGTRNSEAYRAALARRAVVRKMVVAFLDSNHLDAIAYPTLRRKAAIINEPQRGATCQLSAVTGLPALSIPAGFTPDGLPIGVELLGRPLADARLVSFAYDYEQSVHPRRPPSTTPPLVGGRAPKPIAFTATARAGMASARGKFAYDAPRRALKYDVDVVGESAANVFALTIDLDSAGRKGAVLRVLSGPELEHASGTLTLSEPERRELLQGHTALVLYTRESPLGTARVPLSPR
jgi:Asp-tRNA(Asn)/Glu-tRNA(Gln) amidotransferase A subunit family amidase